jgi:hypothetical protein
MSAKNINNNPVNIANQISYLPYLQTISFFERIPLNDNNTRNKSPLRKVEKLKLPLRHQDSKVHKDFICCNLALVKLCAFAPWWQKKKDQSKMNIIISALFYDGLVLGLN